MTDTKTLQQQMADVQKRKGAAVDAENARLAAERAHQQEIEKADAELVRLARLQRGQHLQDVIAEQQAVIRDHQANVLAIISILDTMLATVPDLFAAYQKAAGSYEAQQQRVHQVHQLRQPDWQDDWKASEEYKQCQGLDERLIPVRRDSFRRTWEARNNSMIPMTKSPANDLIDRWLTASKSPADRQHRSAIAALLFGEMR